MLVACGDDVRQTRPGRGPAHEQAAEGDHQKLSPSWWSWPSSVARRVLPALAAVRPRRSAPSSARPSACTSGRRSRSSASTSARSPRSSRTARSSTSAWSTTAKYKLPANAISVIVANSLVSDRFIQMAPAYSGTGPVLADDAKLPVSRTASPGRAGRHLLRPQPALGRARSEGREQERRAQRPGQGVRGQPEGNGAALGNSITQLSAAARTLAAGRGDLFGTVKNLQAFTKALEDSDAAGPALQRATGPGRRRSRRRTRRSRRRAAQPGDRARPGGRLREDERGQVPHRHQRPEDPHRRAGQGEGLARTRRSPSRRPRWPTSSTPTSRTSGRSGRAATWPR